MSTATVTGFSPRILVFSTNNISDPGIDLAGSRHLHYSATVSTMSVPCSSGLKPGWILHAFETGLDGVFIASDGEECALLPECAERTSHIVTQAQELMKARGIEPQRLKMAAVCSVCAEPFVNYMREFSQMLVDMGPVDVTP
ncbi:hydrogenase iron-sulfur subunit [Cellulomonas sp. P24]|uniref:hydrogenase iron-sulfur subunit n=1 Tax=Cellulomonas sp. P24 TaxID=2885206 RepID=UPI00216B28AE|nr:hydrogenase iron-sulfur subunit [Cellulomonas sp. P24]MCR6494381.1 hydrogenase iron-sulfur subunit [Cellulomonas sp. P24]